MMCGGDAGQSSSDNQNVVMFKRHS
jgi:hypothetical protein